jgi:hypothetical protein
MQRGPGTRYHYALVVTEGAAAPGSVPDKQTENLHYAETKKAYP